jgi:TATA-binding protein-associated factor Taf7
MEQHKFDKYRRIKDLMESGDVVPFVVEATGRLGERAQQSLESITETRPVLHNRFIDQLNVVVNQASGQIQYNLRNRLAGSAQG